MPQKSAPLTQAAIRRMIKENVNAAIVAERARHANVGNDARGSGPARGQNAALAARECTFTGFMKCNPTAFRGIEGAVKLRRWFKKIESVFEISECAEGKKQLMTAEFCPIEEVQRMEHELWNLKVKEYNIVAYTQRFNELVLMCSRMVELERVKVDAYIRGLTDNIKLEMKEFRKERNESGRAFKVEMVVVRAIKGINHAKLCIITKGKETRELWLPLLLMESFLCVNDVLLAMLVSVRSSATSVERLGHKLRYCKENNVAMGANALPIPTCYDC
ncbi:putative reverse transcriptase domain-containing protein, partial [Tanacetum coccineum]